MAEVPWIFLSHSGKQKEFTRRLYHELVHVGHRPFFDQDAERSLPKGHAFPPPIVEGCCRCKMGIVVLSHDYIESLWPMLELEQLAFHNQEKGRLLYPLFYRLHPTDLSNQEKLKGWKNTWRNEESAWQSKVQAVQAASSSSHADLHITININSWPQALEMLKYQSGQVHTFLDDSDYIKEIVSNVCKTLPPPKRYMLGNHIKGAHHMQQDIDKLFQKQKIEANGAILLGVYGVGGSGKTTLCKNMAEFYNRDYPGRSFWLEFPTEQDENQLVQAINKFLPSLASQASKKISTIEEAMSYLQEGLVRYKVFLAIDNIWERDLEIASQIVKMEYISGSKVMVTSRSKQLLMESLQVAKTVHVPSLTEKEAVETLCFYSSFSDKEDLRSLAQSCFFEKQCHPLMLKAIGSQLRQVAGRMNTSEDWKAFISNLRADLMHGDEVEDVIVKALEKSFLAMPSRLQSIFINLVTCVPSRYSGLLKKSCECLSMINQDYMMEEKMRHELIKLEYHGLLEIKSEVTFSILEGFHDQRVMIHDLHKHIAGRHLRSSIEHKKKYLWELSPPLALNVNGIKLVDFIPEAEICDINWKISSEWLSVQGMGSLRFLKLTRCIPLKEIKCLKGAPNLVSIELDSCFYLRKVGDMGCLHNLQKLIMKKMTEVKVPNLTKSHKLRTLVLSGIESLKDLSTLGRPPELQELDVSDMINLVNARAIRNFTLLQNLRLCRCKNLQKFPDIYSSNLRTLHLEWCANLQKFPDIKSSNLCILRLESCEDLESMEGTVCALTSLEELNLSYSYKLERIPDLKNLVGLRALQLEGCPYLTELKLGVSSLTSLQYLNLKHCDSLVCNSDVRNLTYVKVEQLIAACGSCFQMELNAPAATARLAPSDAFVNLRELALECSISREIKHSLDVSSLVNLEAFSLFQFSALRFITGLGALLKLCHLTLYECSSLQDFGDLSALTKLVEVKVENVISEWDNIQPSLTTLPRLPASLAHLYLENCCSLTDVSSLSLLSSLEILDLRGCSSLADLSSLTCCTSLETLNLSGCSSLRDASSLPEALGLHLQQLIIKD